MASNIRYKRSAQAGATGALNKSMSMPNGLITISFADFRGCIECGTVEWNSGTVEWWNMPQCGHGSMRMRTRGNDCGAHAILRHSFSRSYLNSKGYSVYFIICNT